jgi:N-acetylglucosamine kinase-like BadF-type ATPase
MFVGFDGGGTKCEGVVVDESGKVLARFIGGSTNQNSSGWEIAEQHFRSVVSELRAQLPSDARFSRACLGMAGVDREAEKHRWSALASQELNLPSSCIGVSNDAVTALASGTGGVLEGVALIAGTGTIAVAMHDGKTWRAQGWGPLLGDEGSGTALGQAALRAVVRAHDRMDAPATRLTELILAATGCARCEELVAWTYRGAELPWTRIASLAPCVETAAQDGDAAAVAILERSSHVLFEAVDACVKKCEGLSRPVVVVFAGGLLRLGGPVSMLLEKRLKAAYGEDIKIVHPTISAGEAAALLASKSK